MNRFPFALLLLGGLVALEVIVPTAFVPLVAVALIAAPFVNAYAWWRLRAKLRQDEATRGADEPLVALQTTVRAARRLAIGSAVTAALGVFVAARALNLVDAIPREVILVILSYPPLLATWQAVDWLSTVGRLEKR